MDITKLKETIAALSIEDLGNLIGYALVVLYKKLREEYNYCYEATIVGDVSTDVSHLSIIPDESSGTGTYYTELFNICGYDS